MHTLGDKICTVYPKFIYFIGMSLAGVAFMTYGLGTFIIPIAIIGAVLFAYGVLVIFLKRIEFYTDAIVVDKIRPRSILNAEDIDRLLWHKQNPYNMALKAQHKPAVKCAIVMKSGPSINLDCGLYGKLEERLREYGRQIGAPSEVV